MATSRVTVYGPLWNGQADAAVAEWVRQTQEALAHQGEAIVKSKADRMNRSGRGGTGRAAAHVSSRVSGGQAVITGSSTKGETWWPWLEGTSKRNQTSRFRGYHTFRMTRGILRKRWSKIAQDELDKFIGQMGGHS